MSAGWCSGWCLRWGMSGERRGYVSSLDLRSVLWGLHEHAGVDVDVYDMGSVSLIFCRSERLISRSCVGYALLS